MAIGVEHTFSCPVDGNPVPNITWYSETGAYTGKQFKAGQSGCFTCVARNIHGISDNITQCLIISKFNFPRCTSTCSAVEPSPVSANILRYNESAEVEVVAKMLILIVKYLSGKLLQV